MKTDLILKFKQNLFSTFIWSSTFKYIQTGLSIAQDLNLDIYTHVALNSYGQTCCTTWCKRKTGINQPNALNEDA